MPVEAVNEDVRDAECTGMPSRSKKTSCDTVARIFRCCVSTCITVDSGKRSAWLKVVGFFTSDRAEVGTDNDKRL